MDDKTLLNVIHEEFNSIKQLAKTDVFDDKIDKVDKIYNACDLENQFSHLQDLDVKNKVIIDYNYMIKRTDSACKLNELLQNIEIASAIEDDIFTFTITFVINNKLDYNLIPGIYYDKFDSLCQNLNPDGVLQNKTFRNNIIKGIILPEGISSLPPQVVHPQRWLTQTKKIELRKYKESNMGVTDAYTCRRCKKKRCSVYIMQTRSADEPATIFITCVECGEVMKYN
jgi:DNA-directed RNA polymerase subunit M/transcription elongation factor TFIIS